MTPVIGLEKQTFESEPQEQVWTKETCLPGTEPTAGPTSVQGYSNRNRRVLEGAKEH